MNWLRKNLFYKVASFLLAVFLWLYVSNEFTGAQQVTLPLEVIGLNQTMVVDPEIPKTVSLRIQGNKDVVTGLSSKDFRAVVDLTEAPLGEGRYPVEVTAPAKVQVLLVTPAELALTLDVIQDREIPVTVKPKEAPAGYVAVEAKARPAAVVVSGPSQKLKSIETALAELAVDNRAAPQTGSVVVRLADNRGKIIESADLQISPKLVEATIRMDVDKTTTQQTFPNIGVGIQNASGDYNYMIAPQQVTLTVEGLIKDMAKLQPENVKVAVDAATLPPGVHNGTPLQVTLPAGIRMVRSEPEGVTVTVQEKTKVGEQTGETPTGQPQTGPR